MRQHAAVSNHNMKTATILTLIIFIGLLSFGQSTSTKKIEPIKIIALKTLPDTELEYNKGEFVLQFSKSLTIKYMDSLFQIYNCSLDSTIYTREEISDIGIILTSIKEYISDSNIVKLTDPLNTYKIVGNKVNYAVMTFSSASNLFDDILCKMFDKGEFNILLNGAKLSSVTKAHVVEESQSYDSESIRYLSQNNFELKQCWCVGLFKDFIRIKRK